MHENVRGEQRRKMGDEDEELFLSLLSLSLSQRGAKEFLDAKPGLICPAAPVRSRCLSYFSPRAQNELPPAGPESIFIKVWWSYIAKQVK